MSVVSDIEIRLRSDIARLQQDMTQARQAVGGAMSSISNAVGGAVKALGALAGAAAVGMFSAWVKSAIDATDAIGDISPATGVATKDIAGLQMAFQFGGLEAGAFESTMIKLSAAIAKDDAAISGLGIKMRSASGEMRASKDVLYDLADAFEKMEDGTAKTALAIDVFGKTGASLIPMLSGGSEGLREMAEMADKLGLTFDQETVDAAGQFNDTLDTMGLASQGIARQMAAQLLPTLNAVSGSFVELITKGDGVRKMSDVIGVGFKVIYTGALAVSQVFDTLSSIIAISVGAVLDGFGTVAKTLKLFIEGEYSAAWEAAQAGAQKTVNSVKNLGGDMVKSWKASANAIGDAWTGDGAKVMEQMNAIGKSAAAVTNTVSKEATKAADDVAKAAQKMADEYAKMILSIEDRVAATQRELDGLAPLTEAQKMHRDLDRQLLAGKIELTAAQTRNYRSLIDSLDANEAAIEANKKAADAARDAADAERLLADERERANQANIAEQKRQWEAIEQTAHDTFVSIADGGKGAAERLKDTFKNVLFDWLYQQTLKKWIIQLEGRATTSSEGGGLGDLFSDSGSGSGGTDWAAVGQKIYSGFSGKASAAGSSGSSGAGGAMGGASSTAMAWLAAAKIGIAIGNKVSSGYSVAGENKSKGFINFSTLTNSVPILGGLVGGIINRAFGRRNKEYGDSTVTGSLGSGGIVGGEVSSPWTQKGGWFKSDRAGKQVDAITQEMSSALVSGFEEIKESVTGYASAFGSSADMLAGYTKTLNVVLTKDAKQNEQLIADLFSSIGEEMATRLIPNIADFKAEGESASATLERLAVNFKVVDAVLDDFGLTSEQTFGAVGIASIAARERLLSLVGGIEGLATQATFFADNFLTAEQRMAPVQARVIDQLAKLGYTGLTTTEEFGAAVTTLAKSGALATQAGAETYAGMLALAPAFKQVADYNKALSDQTIQKAKESADAAAVLAEKRSSLEIDIMEMSGNAAGALAARRQLEIDAMDDSLDYLLLRKHALEDEATAAAAAAAAAQTRTNTNASAAQDMSTLLGTTFSRLQTAVAAEKAEIDRRQQDSLAGLQHEIDNVNGSIETTRNLSESLRNAIKGLRVEGSESASRASAQAQIARALSVAKASGILPSADELADAISAAQASADDFGSYAEYVKATARTANDLEQLGGLAGRQLSIEQRSLEALISQREQVRASGEAQVAKLDGIVSAAQAQIDAINGVDNSVLSVVAALAGFKGALAGVMAPPVIAPNDTVSGLTVAQLYQQVLGRQGEAAGIAYWENLFGQVVDAAEISQFLQGSAAELAAKARGENAWLYTSQQNSRMGGESNADIAARLDALINSMDKVATHTGQFAGQFDNVTAGGNGMLTVPA